MITSTLIAKMITLCGVWAAYRYVAHIFIACCTRHRALQAAYFEARKLRQEYVGMRVKALASEKTICLDPEYQELLRCEAGALIIYQIRTGDTSMSYERAVRALMNEMVY